jgi:hypothetical protein
MDQTNNSSDMPNDLVSVPPLPVQPAASPVQPAVSSLQQPAPGVPGHNVATEGDVQAVPKETVGFDLVEEVPGPLQASDSSLGVPPMPRLPPALPSIPTTVSQPPVMAEDPSKSQAPGEFPMPSVTSAEPTQASADADKSPLEILEEILAEANTEKSKEDEAKKQKEEEKRKFEEEFAAKEAAFQKDAAAQIALKHEELKEASIRREEVEAELTAKGQGNDQASPVVDDKFAINQLEHDKVQQTD